MSVHVARAFVRLREMIASHKELALKLDELERKIATHDQAIAGRIDAIRQLMAPPDLDPFPGDFMFQLTNQELAILRSQFATSSSQTRRLASGGRRTAPYAFTEHGPIMAATVLNSPRAIEVSAYVVRAFVRLREMIAANKELAKKLHELEQRLDTHDQAITEIMHAIRQLMAPPEPKKRPIGFIVPEEKTHG